ncbi:Para-hydroxybenzoate--polyprenyltransferase, mitochondrial precursor (PHB:polyprenyltransferase) [Kickxella alabastrina]|uniref:Para-hydroxybenzoate--polyprenyltransferase, mitochondrial (PHB:polyprenyltransferase) n=1 Tax=Kickxella alabastrina TaxID=61397 RepID=A0ACC1I377_9FUNG|nr:Para-hydroxybenzoate--polyprenyltransferase, mitochondrial precursor (PHB:polyprenyltransferase) [Kickxella alabastrina]
MAGKAGGRSISPSVRSCGVSSLMSWRRMAGSNSALATGSAAAFVVIRAKVTCARAPTLLQSTTRISKYTKPSISIVSTISTRHITSKPAGQSAARSTASTDTASTASLVQYGPFIGRFPESVRPYLYLTRIDKPIGTWLLYWPCVWGIGMGAYATGMPIANMAYLMALFGTGAVVMRGAGCTINDMWDVKFDKMVERTKTRPIASGVISRPKAFVFLGAQLAAGLAVLVQLNPYTIAFCMGSMPLVIMYPFMKRITYWPQLVLGLAFNWGALAGWSAVAGGIDWAVALLLYAAGVSWTLVYDTIYGHQDKRDDIAAGVKSTSLLFAENTKAILSGFSTSTIGLLCLSGYMNGQGMPFYATVLGAGTAHLVWQLRKVNIDDPSMCWKIFKSNTWFGGIIFSAILADLVYSRYMAKVEDESPLLVKAEV